MDKQDFKIIKEETLYKGFLTIKRYHLQHRLFAGGLSPEISRELLVRQRVAAALPYDSVLDKVVLVKQFRVGALEDANGPWLTELVAGLADPDETMEDLIHREAYEEAGLHIQALWPICDYWASPGGSCERVALFCAKVDASRAGGIFGLAEEHEDILVEAISAEEAFAKVANGEINNAATIIGLQWLQLHKAQVQKQWHSDCASK